MTYRANDLIEQMELEQMAIDHMEIDVLCFVGKHSLHSIRLMDRELHHRLHHYSWPSFVCGSCFRIFCITVIDIIVELLILYNYEIIYYEIDINFHVFAK